VIVSCEHADLRLTPDGVWIYRDDAREFLPLDPPSIPRIEVMDELYSAVVRDEPPMHSGEWGLASLEVAVGLLKSARDRARVELKRQVGVRVKPKED
jgi:phthalate 4,5-cis-dihydrodiol dehydrogenase